MNEIAFHTSPNISSTRPFTPSGNPRESRRCCCCCRRDCSPLSPSPVCLTLVRIQFGQSGVGVSLLVIQPFLPPAILSMSQPFPQLISAENEREPAVRHQPVRFNLWCFRCSRLEVVSRVCVPVRSEQVHPSALHGNWMFKDTMTQSSLQRKVFMEIT